MVSPFIIVYFILIPWRFGQLFEVAKSQYERVPTKKIEKGHYAKEINKGHHPKRIIAIELLFKNVIRNYLTIILSIILIITLWRSLDTIGVLFNFLKRKLTRNNQQKEYLESLLKDKCLKDIIFKEFYLLITDIIFLILLILTLLMVF